MSLSSPCREREGAPAARPALSSTPARQVPVKRLSGNGAEACAGVQLNLADDLEDDGEFERC